MLDKTYDPKATERHFYAAWEDSGAFAADVDSPAAPYTIMMPPPNVTGSLHMGHALTFTIQDILIRYHRMIGRDALWQPGTDHAGIATQMVVERQLADQGIDRRDLGRAAFLDKVWAWKAESGGTITHQLRALGASPDWPRERFTMDEGLSHAVRKVFVDLYDQGLIYRDKRLVNWDPKLQTAISDLEVEQREVDGKLWYFKYPLEGRPDTFITVATTRPETMLGDSGVAVHPEDPRYLDLIGGHAILPLVGRRLPIVGDSYSDPEKGSGAVKMTPAHDFNDFEVGRRHDLEMINIFDAQARLNDNVPEAYRGLDRFAARAKVVAAMEAEGLLEKVEENRHVVPHGDRSGVPIEPWLLDQWYVDAATLAGPAIAAVESGRTRFVPKSWENTYFEWMRNIQPWCISRQLWWGHQIPAWFAPDGQIFVAMDAAEAAAAAAKHYGHAVALTQDEDVLDTWFSSGLWPFSTLGWPAPTAELARYYPGDVLVTGFDIIFFWVARMMMLGLHFMDDVPFRTVYIHALVRDAKGQKMSKSKGNVMDPLDLIDSYGTDALRFTLAAMAAQGRDIKLAESRVGGYRNFATKLWNAARFCEINACAVGDDFDPAALNQPVNRWIVGHLLATAEAVAGGFDSYRFNEAANSLYQFIWGTFCDWYLEFSKPVLTGDDAAARDEARQTAGWVLRQTLVILHPIMPFITEELWRQFGQGGQLIGPAWPDFTGLSPDPAAAEEMDWVVRLITEIRSLRAEMNVPPAALIELLLIDAAPAPAAWLAEYGLAIAAMARLSTARAGEGPAPTGAVQGVIDEATRALAIADVIDIDQERARLA
ncbi:MAG: valine--tRNA ligase, partial [Pseudomonadota bacterium]|nr:valine--tRNA ligase [Pseudomonadota bacterium]